MDKNHPFQIGKSYVFRTVTMINLGRLVKVVGDFAIIEDAGWVADTGRYGDFLKHGSINEYEVYPTSGENFVNLSTVVDVQEWAHPLPTQSK